MRLAAAPISWGVCEVPGWGLQLPPSRVLDDARRLGFDAIEAGPPGFLPADAGRAKDFLTRHGLRLVGGFVTALLHDRARLTDELAAVERQVRWLAAAGAEVLVLAAASGRANYEEAAELAAHEWRQLLEALARVAELSSRYALALAVHPHVGTAIERREEIERLIVESDVALCLDTGHAYIGGADSAAIAKAVPRRIRHVHLKDADASLAAAVRSRRIGYATAVARGLYRPLGDGDAGVDRVLAALKRSGYAGWHVLEQDQVLQSEPTEGNDPARAITRSRDFALAHA